MEFHFPHPHKKTIVDIISIIRTGEEGEDKFYSSQCSFALSTKMHVKGKLLYSFLFEKYSADENPNRRPFSSALILVEETPSWTTTLSVVMGMLVALIGLLVLLAFLQYRRLRKGYAPLMETHLSNKRYTEEA